MNAPRQLTIDIWSDVMCPWCLIGWGNLRQALAKLEGEIAAEIRWHAFELNPDMTAAGEESTAHIARKYGRTPDQSRAIQQHMRQSAKAAGVSLDYEGSDPQPPAMVWNTFAAHKLLTWAGEQFGAQRQTDLKLALFKAHFNDRRPIGTHTVLLDIAEEQGFSRHEAELALNGEEISHRVRAEERAAWDLNITGVPAMIIEGKFLVPGAQAPETYIDILRRIDEKLA